MQTKQMIWYRHVKSTKWEKIPVIVQELPWSEVSSGDVIFIAGNLKDGKPTILYGKHTVINSHLHILENSAGKQFTEQWPTLFRETHKPSIPQLEGAKNEKINQ